MPYCTKCGAYHDDKNKYCDKCGHKIEEGRKKYYSGDLHKCPNCGEMINTFETKCNICGYEIRGTKSSSTIVDFSKRLEELERQRNDGTLLDDLKSIIRGKSLSPIEEQIITHITTYPIPNTKEDIFEFAILASSNIESNLNEEENDSNYHKALQRAWKSKFDQAYKKAKTLFPNDPEFVHIQNIVTENDKKVKNSRTSKIIITLSIIFGVMLFVGLICLIDYLDNRSTDPEAFRIGCSSDELVGEDYEYVYDVLKSKGFTDIRFKDLNDLNDITNIFYDDGQVKSVSIGGDSDFKEKKYFSKNDIVIITYHSYPDN